MKFIEKLKPSIAPLPEGCKATDPAMLLATWFGAGRIRPAPGTFGSIAAVPFGIGLQYVYGIPALIFGIVVMLVLGVIVSNIYEAKDGEHDSKSIVIDEVVGVWIAGIPAATNLTFWIGAFILFRIFDIWKPWPISKIDRDVEGGLGVMMDDVVAGFVAMLGVAGTVTPYLGHI